RAPAGRGPPRQPPLRDVGLWAEPADGAHGVHGHRLLAAVQADLRGPLPAGEAARHRVPPRVPLLRPDHPLREPDPRRHRRVALPSAPDRRPAAGRRGPARPVRQREPLPGVHLRGPAGPPPDRAMTLPGLLVSLAQAILVGAAAPLLVGLIRLLKARLQGRPGASLVQPYRDLRKLLAKEVVLSETTSWIFRVTPFLLAAIMLVIAGGIPIVVTRLPLAFTGN